MEWNVVLVSILWGCSRDILYYVLRLIPLLAYPLFGFRVYKVSRADHAMHVCKNANGVNSSCTLDGEHGYGIIWGRWYVGEIEIATKWNNMGVERTAWLFTNDYYYKQLIGADKDDASRKKTTITMLENTSVYPAPTFSGRSLFVYQRPSAVQQAWITQMMRMRSERQSGSLSCYLYGPTGTGKSMATILLAHACGGKYCNDLRLESPGQALRCLYNYSGATSDVPLVLVLEEIDVLLRNMHESKIKPGKKLQMGIVDKQSWNLIMDNIDNGFYPNLILILTSNKLVHEIDSMDPSYLRKGRVHLKYAFTSEYGDADSQ